MSGYVAEWTWRMLVSSFGRACRESRPNQGSYSQKQSGYMQWLPEMDRRNEKDVEILTCVRRRVE
jgi:hypothetical protein